MTIMIIIIKLSSVILENIITCVHLSFDSKSKNNVLSELRTLLSSVIWVDGIFCAFRKKTVHGVCVHRIIYCSSLNTERTNSLKAVWPIYF